MHDDTKSIYSELLSELQVLEQRVQQQKVEGIEEWKDKVSKHLKGAYRARFSRLRFYEEYEEYSISDDDIPF